MVIVNTGEMSLFHSYFCIQSKPNSCNIKLYFPLNRK